MTRLMRRIARCAAGAVVGLAGGALLAPAAAHADPALSATGIQQNGTSVRFFLTGQGLPAGGAIDPDSVRVSANGVPLEVSQAQPVARGGQSAQPRRLTVLVMDTSGSMSASMPAARSAAEAYVAALPADIEVAVVTAGASAQTALPPTGDRKKVNRAIDGLQPGGGTALYDGVKAALGLTGTAGYAERRVMVLSDGADTDSATSLPALRAALAGPGRPVDTVAFRTGDAVTGVLSDLSRRSGGTAYVAADVAALTGAFHDAAAAFSEQLAVTAQVPGSLAGKQVRMKITANAAGRVVATYSSIQFAIDPHAVVARTAVSARGPSMVLFLIIGLVVFAAMLALALVVLAPMLRRPGQTTDAAPGPEQAPMPGAAESDGAVARAALSLSARAIEGGGLERRIAAALDRAGLRMRPHEWLLWHAFATLVPGAVLALLWGVVGLVFGLLTGALAGVWYLHRRGERRTQAFATLLPDALQLVVGSLRSGFSLSQAIDAMIKELPDPISTEFARALGEMRLGSDLEDAIERVAFRMRSEDLRWAVVAMRVQRDVGGNLAEVLETAVQTMRERDALRREVRSLSAEGRISAWILLALPVGMAIFMFTVRREYIRPLYTEPLGIGMLSAGVVLVAIGGFWMSRIVKVKA